MPFFHLPLQYVLYSVILLVEAYNDPIGQSEINCVPIGLAVNNQVSVQTSNMQLCTPIGLAVSNQVSVQTTKVCCALLLVQRLATSMDQQYVLCAPIGLAVSNQVMCCALLLISQLATRFQKGQAICSVRSYWSCSQQTGYSKGKHSYWSNRFLFK